MSDVSFRIDQRDDYGVDGFPSVFARISLLDQHGRTVRGSTLNELVPISSRKGDVLVLNLKPGTYTIEVRLPTGELLADSVVVREDIESNVVLRAQSVPDEWRGFEYYPGNVDWQQRSDPTSQAALAQRDATYSGMATGKFVARKSARNRSTPTNPPEIRGAEPPTSLPRQASEEAAAPAQSIVKAPSSNVAYEAKALFFRVDPDAKRRDLLQRIGLNLYDGKILSHDWQREPAVWRSGEPAQIDSLRAIHLLESFDYPYEPDFLQSNPWETLPSVVGATASILAGLKLGTNNQVIHPIGGDNSSAAFQFATYPVDASSWTRRFAVVRRRMGVELICLPTNCEGLEPGHFAAIGVAVRRPRYEHEFSTSINVRDRRMALLLAFLSNGDLSMVSQLAEHSSLMLFDKNADPVAAAAGGYALVGSAVNGTHQPWHTWIENLKNRFRMPDGAIQYGMMRLRLRTSESDVREAAEAFKLAYRRGLPIFGIGMRWLLDGLEQTAAIDEQAREMAAAVRRLSFRLHPQSAFTILRLGKR